MPYRPTEIEPAWQTYWLANETFVAREDRSKPKFYALDMFPYPSGKGLHVGHPAGYTASDVVSRYKRARGFNVLHPMGYDSFGLPAEQRAIDEGIAPQKTTAEAIENFRRQLQRLGFSYDWSRELSTADPGYYKWTQWIFTRLYEKGLAYEGEVFVNWCPALGTVLANDEVIDGKSERGGHPVERKKMRQWMLKQTAYAERFLEGLEAIDWPEATKTKQREWIGKSEGAFVDFVVQGSGSAEGAAKITVFTTRPDTLWGATYMVLAPEHALVEAITTEAQRERVRAYQQKSASRSEVDRQTAKQKTGVDTGAKAINPVTGQQIPVWIADYVLAGYGTGAIMAVPAHDERDWEFARAMGLPIVEVVSGGDVEKAAHAGEGVLVNSGPFDGTPTKNREAVRKVIAYLEEKKLGQGAITYKMRDWAFARQRYWGEPIPVLRNAEGNVARTLGVDELPLVLPEVSDFRPTGTGESPLSRATDWVTVRDEKSGATLTRETDTMPGSAGSSWYFLRYCDPHNDREFCARDKSDYWMPVDLYVGGAEHSVGHLIYARMWQKVLRDLGLVRDDEPFAKLRHQGMILGETFYDASGRIVPGSRVEEREGQYIDRETGAELRRAVEKMTKRYGNVVDPDKVVSKYGSDALRVYICFMGPLESDKPWQTNGLEAQYNWLKRAWRLFFDTEGEGDAARDLARADDSAPSEVELRVLHKAIEKVTHDIETLNLNTAISALHVATRDLLQLGSRSRAVLAPFAQLIAPFAPHFAEEVYKSALAFDGGISFVPWPAFDTKYTVDETVTVPVQVSGKTKGTVQVPRGAGEDAVKSEAMKLEAVARAVEGKSLVRVVFVPDRMLNLVVK